MRMARRIHFTPQQIHQIEQWISENYVWAKENLLDEACWIDIHAGIETEMEAMKTSLIGLMGYDPVWRKNVLGSEKKLGKMVKVDVQLV